MIVKEANDGEHHYQSNNQSPNHREDVSFSPERSHRLRLSCLLNSYLLVHLFNTENMTTAVNVTLAIRTNLDSVGLA